MGSLTRFEELKESYSRFWKADRETKIRILKRSLFNFIIVAALFPMPWFIAHIQTSVKEDRDQVLLDHASTEEKWQRVRSGSARIKCENDAVKKIKNKGLDPMSLDGINFAIDNGLCTFITIEKYSGPKQMCIAGQRWETGECVPEPLPMNGSE